MKRISLKEAAEAVLRDLPSVVGAYVQEDADGRPREIHILVRPDPDTGPLARAIHTLLEERLGVPVDRRIISIAQLARNPGSDSADSEPGDRRPDVAPHRSDSIERTARGVGRPVFVGLESTARSGHARVASRLEWGGVISEGVAEAVDTRAGRARAAAMATLRSAADAPWTVGLGLELEFASVIQALDGEYVLASVLAVAGRLGRRPQSLSGAHVVEDDVETAAAMATLKAVNRVLTPTIIDDRDR